MTCILIADDLHFNCLTKKVFTKQKIISSSNYCNFHFKNEVEMKMYFQGYASVAIKKKKTKQQPI